MAWSPAVLNDMMAQIETMRGRVTDALGGLGARAATDMGEAGDLLAARADDFRDDLRASARYARRAAGDLARDAGTQASGLYRSAGRTVGDFPAAAVLVVLGVGFALGALAGGAAWSGARAEPAPRIRRRRRVAAPPPPAGRRRGPGGRFVAAPKNDG
jgi:hypothetical protein